MSYLQLDNGIPDFSKAVISLWFRVPQSSIDAAIADSDARPPEFVNVLPYTIPLITFGAPQTRTRYEGDETIVSIYHYVPIDGLGNPLDTSVPPLGMLDTPTYSAVADDPVDPSYIVVKCRMQGGENTASLSFNLQTAGYAAISGLQFNRSRVDVYDASAAVGDVPALIMTPGSGWTADPRPLFTTLVDTSYTYSSQPEFFRVDSTVRIAPDHWHHLLLSFDLDNACITHGPPQIFDPFGSRYHATVEGTDSYCRLGYAIDDVNYDTFDLGPYDVDGGVDVNAILPQTAYFVANSSTSLPGNATTSPASYSYDPSVIPAHGAPLGIPASTSYLARVYPVEMAEVQVFTGVTLDTSIEANRRAFITSDGKPADPLKKPNPTPPSPPPGPPPLKGPQELLGKEPELLLHGSGNWIAGKNTGKDIKLNEIGKPTSVPAENLKPTGSIVAYSPDPSLHGRQSPPPPPPT